MKRRYSRKGLYYRRAAERGRSGRGFVPAAGIRESINCGRHQNRRRYHDRYTSLERGAKQIFDRAVRVLAAYLGFVVIGISSIDRVRVRVQLQQKRIRHHYSDKEQEQEEGDIV